MKGLAIGVGLALAVWAAVLADNYVAQQRFSVLGVGQAGVLTFDNRTGQVFAQPLPPPPGTAHDIIPDVHEGNPKVES